MKVFAIILWVGVCIAVGVSVLILFGGMASATGAPQEAVVVSLAIAVSVIPYVFARSITEIAKMYDSGSQPSPPVSAPSPSSVVPPAPEYKYNYQKVKKEGSMLDLD